MGVRGGGMGSSLGGKKQSLKARGFARSFARRAAVPDAASASPAGSRRLALPPMPAIPAKHVTEANARSARWCLQLGVAHPHPHRVPARNGGQLL